MGSTSTSGQRDGCRYQNGGGAAKSQSTDEPEYGSFHLKKKLVALVMLGLLHKVERGKVGLFYVKKHVDERGQIQKNMRDLFSVSLKYPVTASIVPTRKRPMTTSHDDIITRWTRPNLDQGAAVRPLAMGWRTAA